MRISAIACPCVYILVRYRIFPAADGACARFAAAHAGAGSLLDVAGVVFTGTGMSFIPVGYPIAPIVIQRRQLRIGGVVAARAGVVGPPAGLGAGGSLRGMGDRVVSQRRQLRIGGVVAAGAGIVGLPAGLGAGSGLAGMGNRVMSQRRQLLIGAVVAAGAGSVGLPALFRAGGSLRGMGDQVVVVRIYIAENKGTTLVIAIGTDPGIHSLRYAGGCSLLMHFE